MLPPGVAESPSEVLRNQWSAIGCVWDRARAPQFGFVTGWPIRFHAGGLGGNLILGLRPAPALLELWHKVKARRGAWLACAVAFWETCPNAPSLRPRAGE